MNTITIQIVDLKPDPDNARTHDAKNIASIVGSLKEFGQQKPIVIDKKNRIVAGNGTVTAALEIGWTEISAVRTNLTGDKAKAFALADNRTAELADWDRDILKVQLGELVKVDMDIQALGFNLDEVGEEGEEVEGLTDPDAVPEVPQNVFGVERGDIWQLGEHRVMCGDSTDKGDVERLMDGAKADMVFTSPPYADMRDYGGNDLSVDTLKHFINPAISDVWFVNLGLKRDKGRLVRYWDEYIEHAENSGLPLISWMVWDRGESGSVGNQTAIVPVEHEWIFLFSSVKPEIKRTVKTKHANKKVKATRRGRDGSLTPVEQKDPVATMKKHGTVIRQNMQKGLGDIDHPAKFPVALPEKFVDMTDSATVYEPFCGSGSTLIACEKTNRKCYGSEIDPHYCSVIIKRWQDFTGQEAKRIAKG